MNHFFIRFRIDSGRKPIGIVANEITLQLLQITAVTELDMVGFFHGIVPKEKVGKLSGIIGAFVDVAFKGGINGLTSIFHRLSFANLVNTQIFIGVRT